MNKKKICMVVQRYGNEVNGGAELHCREISEHMTDKYDVTVLTTKAIDYMTWQDEYTCDEEEIRGVHVKRFSVDTPRNIESFSVINGKFFAGEQIDERKWVDEQGPKCDNLIKYIVEHKDDYHCFIFFTYLYYQTVIGIHSVKEKAILVPDAHDEPFLNMEIYKELFKAPRSYFFNTEEEKDFVYNKFATNHIPCEIGGIGINDTLPVGNVKKFKNDYGLNNYMVYVGRIDEGKNCPELFEMLEFYNRYAMRKLKLVLVGKAVIDVPERDDIVKLGFVDEDVKYAAIAGAKFLILPSMYESLSIVVLEAMKLGIPAIVNGKCDVLKGHCTKSNAALYYNDYYEFEGAVNYILRNPAVARKMGENGQEYVRKNYRWEVLTDKLSSLIERI